jgi:hypothetical protein
VKSEADPGAGFEEGTSRFLRRLTAKNGDSVGFLGSGLKKRALKRRWTRLDLRRG